jgi:hypothetical protein
MDDFWLPLGIFKPFFYIALSVPRWTTFDYPLVSSNGQTMQCNRKVWRYQGVIKSRSLKTDGRLLITPWYLQIFYYIVLSVIQWTTFDYSLVSSNLSITLHCLSFFNGRFLITPKIWRYQGVIKSRPLKKDRQYSVIERLEDTKG